MDPPYPPPPSFGAMTQGKTDCCLLFEKHESNIHGGVCVLGSHFPGVWRGAIVRCVVLGKGGLVIKGSKHK